MVTCLTLTLLFGKQYTNAWDYSKIQCVVKLHPSLNKQAMSKARYTLSHQKVITIKRIGLCLLQTHRNSFDNCMREKKVTNPMLYVALFSLFRFLQALIDPFYRTEKARHI